MNGSVYKNVMVRGVNGIASLEGVWSVGQNADLVPPFADFADVIIFLSETTGAKGAVGLGGRRLRGRRLGGRRLGGRLFI